MTSLFGRRSVWDFVQRMLLSAGGETAKLTINDVGEGGKCHHPAERDFVIMVGLVHCYEAGPGA